MRKTFTLLLALLAFTVSTWATQIGPVDGFYYDVDDSGNATLVKDPTAENNWLSYGSSVAGGMVTIPGTVTYNDTDYPVKAIGEYAFANCSDMTAVVIGEGVTTIERSAFFACSYLTTASLPSTITDLGDFAFEHCSNFTTLICRATLPPTFGDNIFYNVTAVAQIYAPSAAVNDYKTAEGWSDYASVIQAIPASVTWNAENGLASIDIMEYTNYQFGNSIESWNDGTKVAVIEGVVATISATADGTYANMSTYEDNTSIYLSDGATLTFTSFFGKFSRIVINTNDNIFHTGEAGWSWDNTEHTYTWSSANAAASVVLPNTYLRYITSIVFTFEDNTPDPTVISTVTWDDTDLATVDVGMCTPNPCSQTIKEIKVTNNADYADNGYCTFDTSNGQMNNDDWADFSMREGGSLTFSTKLGNFTSIVITCDAWREENLDTSTGWTWYSNTKKLIWSGEAASSVTLASLSSASDNFTSGPIDSIVFTIESVPAPEPDEDADVVWLTTDLEDVSVIGNENVTIKDITATTQTSDTQDLPYFTYDEDEQEAAIYVNSSSTLTFTASEDLEKIVIRGEVNTEHTNLDALSGWSYDDNTLTWSGEHASSVVLSNVFVEHIIFIEFHYYDAREVVKLRFSAEEATIIKDIYGWLFEPGTTHTPQTSYYVSAVREFNVGTPYYFTNYYYDLSELDLSVSYTLSNSDVISITSSDTEGFEFEVLDYGTVVVTASTNGNETYQPAKTTMTISVIEGKSPNREGVLAFAEGTPNAGQLLPDGYKFELETGEEMTELELREKDDPEYYLAPCMAVWYAQKRHLAYFKGDKFLRALTAGEDSLVVRYSRYNDGDENGNWLYIKMPVYIKPTELALTSSVDFTSNPSSNSAIANNADYDAVNQQINIGDVLSDTVVQAALDCYAYGHPGWNDALTNTVSFELPQGKGSFKVTGNVQDGCELRVKIRSESNVHRFSVDQVAAGEAIVEYDVPDQTAVVIYIGLAGGPAPSRTPTAKNDAPLAALSAIDMSPTYPVATKVDPDNAGVYYSTHYNETQKYQLPAGTEAYVATLSEGDLNMTRVATGGQVIPADEAFILKSTSAAIELIPTDAEAVTINAANDLQGTDMEKAAPANCYVLSGHSTDESVTGVGFYLFTGTLAAHKAYLVYNGETLAPSHRMRFIFDSEHVATTIDNNSATLSVPRKYLENGLLIIENNGTIYNAQGQVVK